MIPLHWNLKIKKQDAVEAFCQELLFSLNALKNTEAKTEGDHGYVRGIVTAQTLVQFLLSRRKADGR